MFYALTSCAILFLDNNLISEVESGSFNDLSNLKRMEMSRNLLTTLRAGTFQGLVALTSLYLTGNKISFIQDNTFFTLKNLQKLYLGNNALGTLSHRAFHGLDSLTHLSIYQNYLTTLPADIFNHLPRPLELFLDIADNDLPANNPIECNSELCWLKREELQWTITWLCGIFKPRCANGIDWDTWNCDETGKKISHLIMLAHLRVSPLIGCENVARFDNGYLLDFGIFYKKDKNVCPREGIYCLGVILGVFT